LTAAWSNGWGSCGSSSDGYSTGSRLRPRRTPGRPVSSVIVFCRVVSAPPPDLNLVLHVPAHPGTRPAQVIGGYSPAGWQRPALRPEPLGDGAFFGTVLPLPCGLGRDATRPRDLASLSPACRHPARSSGSLSWRSRSMARLRACCTAHAPAGCVVTPARCRLRAPRPVNTSTYSRLSSTVPATRKSRAMIARAWAARNCRRADPARRGAGPVPAASRISRTADAAIAYPGRASSPWILLCPRPDSPAPSQRSAS